MNREDEMELDRKERATAMMVTIVKEMRRKRLRIK